MRRQIALAAVLVSIVFAPGLPARQTPAPVQQPVFRSGAAFVRVDVYPSKDGRIVSGLTKNDFQLFEDGKPQTIETFDYVDFPTFASEEERRDPVNKEEGDALAADPRNRVFVIYLDTIHVSISDAYYSRSPLIAMLDRTIGPSDVFGVLTPRQTYASLVFGRKVKSTEDMLTRNWAWGDNDQTYTMDPESRVLRACFGHLMEERDIELLVAREREDRNFRRLRELVDYLGRLRQEKKHLVMFSHGWDLAGPSEHLMTAIRRAPRPKQPAVSLGGKLVLGDMSHGILPETACENDRIRLANEDFRIRHRELLDAAKRANVSFYPVNPAGLSAATGLETVRLGEDARASQPLQVKQVEQRRNAGQTAVDHLRELASNTDGIAVVDTNDLRTAMMKITDSLSAYYLLGYYPTNAKQDGSTRRISVKGPAGLDMMSRRQYVAADEKDELTRRATAAAVAAKGPAPAPKTATEIDAAFDALLRLAASRADITGRAVMLNRTELTVVAEAALPVTADTDIQIIVNGADGNAAATGRGRIAAGARAVAIRATLSPGAPGSKGPWQVVMRVSGGELRGGEAIPLEVPAGLLGDAQLLRIVSGAPGASAGLGVAAPVARPVFSRRERLRATWTTLDAADVTRHDAAADLTRHDARILDRRGQPLPVDATVSVAPAGTRTAVSVDVTLAPLAPGDYVLELVVAPNSSTGASSRHLIGFRVTQ